MNQNLIRIYAVVCLWMLRLQLWAQSDDMEELTSSKKSDDDDFFMQEMLDYQPFHIRFTDILMVVLLIVCCYVFGKIWKGCTYLILAFAAFMYFFIL